MIVLESDGWMWSRIQKCFKVKVFGLVSFGWSFLVSILCVEVNLAGIESYL